MKAALLLSLMLALPAAHAASSCDKACMEAIGDKYRAAYVKHDPKLAPFARKVRFTENNVEMEFPDASWDTVTEEVGPALTLSDTKTGNVGIYTSIMQNDTPGFLAIRLKVVRGQITEVEHMLSTKRNLSGPPTPIGDVREFKFDPDNARSCRPSSAFPASGSSRTRTATSRPCRTTPARSAARGSPRMRRVRERPEVRGDREGLQDSAATPSTSGSATAISSSSTRNARSSWRAASSTTRA